MEKRQVFISYSHKDRRWLIWLKPHLMALRGQCDMTFWDDTAIEPGDHWRTEIWKAIEAADHALLLVSPDFLASSFIIDEELPKLLSQFHDGAGRAVCVYVRHSVVDAIEVAYPVCDGQTVRARLTDLQGYIAPDKPLAELSASKRDKVLANLARTMLGTRGRATTSDQTSTALRESEAIADAKAGRSARVIVEMDGDLDSWTPEAEASLISHLARSLEIGPSDIVVKRRSRGSVVLELEMPPIAAFEFVELAELGAFKALRQLRRATMVASEASVSVKTIGRDELWRLPESVLTYSDLKRSPVAATSRLSGLRLNAFEFARCTEQAAILASGFAGLQSAGPTPVQMERIVQQWLIAAMTELYCNPLFLHAQAASTSRLTSERLRHPEVGMSEEFDVDVVCTTVDGAASLRYGWASCASVVAVGSRGSFGELPHAGTSLEPAAYLAVVASATAGKDVFVDLPIAPDGITLDDGGLEEVLVRAGVFEQVKSKSLGSQLAVGTLGDGPSEWWRVSSGRAVRRVAMEGSRTLAALSTLLLEGGTDLTCMTCNHAEAIHVATACKALAGSAMFVPIRKAGRKAGRKASGTRPSGPLVAYGARDLVPGDEVLLFITGISSGPALTGVRFRDASHVSTDSLCLSSASGSIRRLRHDWDLAKTNFVAPNARVISALSGLEMIREVAEATSRRH